MPLLVNSIVFLALMDVSMYILPFLRDLFEYLASAIRLATWVYLQVDCRLMQAKQPGRPRSHCEWLVSICW